MNANDDNKGCGCVMVIIAIILSFLAYFAMSSAGYHPQWSWTHGDFIWVDQEGKPAP
jgi:hypothetical protein